MNTKLRNESKARRQKMRKIRTKNLSEKKYEDGLFHEPRAF